MQESTSVGVQVGSHCSETLPAEIWLQIMENLSHHSIKACLQVCRAWHEVALVPLFSTTRLYFGTLDFPAEWAKHTDDDQHLHRDEYRLIGKSADILFSIASNPYFARLIKHLVIYCPSRDDNVRLIFETRCLSNVFVHLPQLNSFEWHGIFAESCIPDGLLSSLVKSCSQLHHIRFPFSHSRPVSAVEVRHLKHLDSIADTSTDKTHLTVNMLSGSGICNLELSNLLSPFCIPDSVIAHLHDLTLKHPPHLALLFKSLSQARFLVSLSLLDVDRDFDDELLEVKDFLPSLSAFAITSPAFTTEDVAALCEFLSDRRAMKRLCLRSKDDELESGWADFLKIVSVVEGMSGLEAFAFDGLSENGDEDDDDDDGGDDNHNDEDDETMFKSAFNRLPSSLQVLDMKIPSQFFDTATEHIAKKFPLLSFATFSVSGDDREQEIEQMTQALASRLPRLQHLVFDDDIFDVGRHPDCTIAQPLPWSALKRVTCCSADFCNRNARWLMRVSPPLVVGVEDTVDKV